MEEINVIGVVGLAVFVLTAVTAIVCFFKFDLPRLAREAEEAHGPMGIWKDPRGRTRFLTLLGVNAVGITAGVIAILWGGFGAAP